MIDLETTFRNAARKLKSPTSRDFVLDDWRSAFKELAAPDSDHDRMIAARWLGANPTRRTAPAGSNRSSHGGNEVAEAFDQRVTNWWQRECAGRNASER